MNIIYGITEGGLMIGFAAAVCLCALAYIGFLKGL